MSLQKSFYKVSALMLLSIAAEQVCAHEQLSNSAIISTYQGTDGSWKYLEYLFVVQPNHKIQTSTQHALGFLGATGAATLTASYAQQLPQYSMSKNMINDIVFALSLFATGSASYNYFLCHTKRKVYKETLKNILDNWSTHRKHLPIQFIDCLDELYVSYQEHAEAILTTEMVTQVFELIQHHIEHNFESRYKKDEVKHETALSNVKSLSEIMNNLR